MRSWTISAIVAVLIATIAFANTGPELRACNMDRDALIDVGSGAPAVIGGRGAHILAENQFALTFDDGPMPWTTSQIVDILNSECTPATFFMVGASSLVFPTIVSRVKKSGAAIGSHGLTHRNVTTLPNALSKHEIQLGIKAVRFSANERAESLHLIRFPHHAFGEQDLEYVKSANASVVMSDVSPEDWRGLPPEETFKLFLQRLGTKDRGIINLHDSQPNTVKLLPMIVAEIKRRGGRFVQFSTR